jgi:hypothetical protein
MQHPNVAAVAAPASLPVAALEQGRVMAGDRNGGHQVGMAEALRLVVGRDKEVRFQSDLVPPKGMVIRLVGVQPSVDGGVRVLERGLGMGVVTVLSAASATLEKLPFQSFRR